MNPRLVKEADALTDAGYNVTVLYTYWNDWGTKYDGLLLADRKWKAIRVGGHPVFEKRTYDLSRVIFALIRKTASLGLGTDNAVARGTYFLSREAKKHQADIYIAHNLGALPAAVKAAKHNNKLCGFDAEDFHRNEVSNDATNKDVILKTGIENKYIPQLNYFTASSPQIADAYHAIFGKRPVVLLNVFPKSTLSAVEPPNKGPIKLFWFSQTIGPSRGLEDIINALRSLNKDRFELHLLGDRPTSVISYLNGMIRRDINVVYHSPVHPDGLNELAKKFDIGLALEPAFSKNNDMALSNKLFTYMQAGLSIIASDTAAQQDFMHHNPQIGKTYPKGDHEALAKILSGYSENREALLTNRREALRLAHEKYNWELESKTLLKLVANTLANG